jgi:cell division protein FtsB
MKRIVMLFIAFFFITALSKSIFEYRKNLSFHDQYKQEYEKEKKRNVELKTQLVKTEDSFEFEKTARNKLNLHKQDEVMVVIPNPTPTVFEPTPTQIPNYIKWLDMFMKN